jgi:hypothetical protein
MIETMIGTGRGKEIENSQKGRCIEILKLVLVSKGRVDRWL